MQSLRTSANSKLSMYLMPPHARFDDCWLVNEAKSLLSMTATDSPRIAACLKQHPQVRDAAVVQFYDRGARHNLYAFVEAGPDVSEHALRDFVTRKLADVAPPAHVHVSEVLPRAASGDIRTEILQLVASNQLDEIDSLLTNDAERATVAGLVAQRRNLHDRF